MRSPISAFLRSRPRRTPFGMDWSRGGCRRPTNSGCQLFARCRMRLEDMRRTAVCSPHCLGNFADGRRQWVMVNLVGSQPSWITLKRSRRLPTQNLMDLFHAGTRHRGRAWGPNNWYHAPLAPSLKRRCRMLRQMGKFSLITSEYLPSAVRRGAELPQVFRRAIG